MKISVTIKPGAKVESVEQKPDGSFAVRVKAPAHEGRANEALIRVLAKHFSVPPSSITIVHGHRGRKKIVEILTLKR